MKLKKLCGNISFLVFVMLFFTSCSEIKQIIIKESPREKYISRLEKAGLLETEMSQKWIAEGERVLNQPLHINLPYREQGFFFANAPGAHGYLFEARQGEKILVQLRLKDVNLTVFMDLFVRKNPDEIELVTSAGDELTIEQEAKGSNNYILRIQHELLNGGSFELTIELNPTLAFPVAGHSALHIQSFWHAPRDGGSRKHEGVDVFAPRGTPVVAAADGLVTRTSTNRLGGNIVFVRTRNKSLYYAHLEDHNVTTGKLLKTGDTLGFVGNSGNAVHTASHLHFGIYTMGGAVDPLPYINDKRPQPPPVQIPVENIGKWARAKTNTHVYAGPDKNSEQLLKLAINEPFAITGGVANQAKIRLYNGIEGYVSKSAITNMTSAIRNITLKPQEQLKISPDTGAQVILTIEENIILPAMAEANNHWMIAYGEQLVWLEK